DRDHRRVERLLDHDVLAQRPHRAAGARRSGLRLRSRRRLRPRRGHGEDQSPSGAEALTDSPGRSEASTSARRRSSRKERCWRRVLDYLIGDQATWVADIGLKAELFAAIAAAGRSGIGEAELAARLGYDARY